MSEQHDSYAESQPNNGGPVRRSTMDRMAEQPTTASGSSQGTQEHHPGQAGGASAPASATQAMTQRRSTGIRRIRMTLSHVDPLSALKLGFLVSVVVGIMIVLAMALIWSVLDGMTVFSQLNELLVTLNSEALLKLAQYLEFSRWMSFAVIIAIVDVVLFTLLSLIGALVYNLISALVGGVKVTLSDE